MGETHESYGLIGASRIQGTDRNLFGSSIKHRNSIKVRIKRAEKSRDLNRDIYFGKDTLIEVELSPTQFAEMITSMNVSDGVPCTLRYIDNHPLQNPPEVKQRQIFEKEFQNDIDNIENSIINDAKEIEILLTKKGNIKVADRKKVLTHMTKLMRILNDSIPFLQKSFNESMDKTVNEAKGEVEAFVMNKITSLGIEAMKDQPTQLLENTK